MKSKSLGQYFQAKRIEAGLSLEETCKDIAFLSVEELKDFESGFGTIGLSTMAALANLLNADPEEILSRSTAGLEQLMQKSAIPRSEADGMVLDSEGNTLRKNRKAH